MKGRRAKLIQVSTMPLTQYYHVRDPMENLLISVTLRKVGKHYLLQHEVRVTICVTHAEFE